MNNSVRNLIILVCFIGIGLLLYFPVIDKSFVSDDYTVLYRLIKYIDFTPEGFFRPAADLSLYITYILFGLAPIAFNSVNIILHSLTSWLLFIVCNKALGSFTGNAFRISLASAVVFLIYPFHQEAIVWGLGRGIIQASLFSLLSVYVLLNKKNPVLSTATSAVLFFIALASYESVLILPVLLIALLVFYRAKKRLILISCMFFLLAIIFNVLFRYLFSGSIVGSYGNQTHGISLMYVGSYLKSMGRLVMRPFDNPVVFIISAIISLGFLSVFLFKAIRKHHSIKPILLSIIFFLLLSLLIPSYFAVSTKTTESDRLLYFPSIFISIIIALAVTNNNKKGWIYGMVLLVFSIVWLYQTNMKWKRSGQYVNRVIELIKTSDFQKLYVINLPGSDRGMYIFRNGFYEALLLNGIDTGKVTVVNSIRDIDNIKATEILHPDKIIQKSSGRSYKISGSKIYLQEVPFSVLYFENNKLKLIHKNG